MVAADLPDSVRDKINTGASFQPVTTTGWVIGLRHRDAMPVRGANRYGGALAASLRSH
jgi:hypothetical protein